MNVPCVLILENQSALLSALVRGLQELGVRDILEAAEGEEALKLIKAHGGVDIVFCDMSTQGMSGLEFLRKAAAAGLIRAVALCRELPPEQGRAVKLMAHRTGLNLLGYVMKPLQEWSLQNLLAQYSRRHQVLFEQEELSVKASIEEDLQRALALREFHPYFQPTLNLQNGIVAGVEVSMKWHHPLRGILQPEEFVQDLVALNLMDELFGQLFDLGMNMLSVLQRKRFGPQLAFKLHTCQLENSQTIDRIQRLLYQHDIQSKNVSFALSERELQHASDGVFERINILKSIGCHLAIDDFEGQGLSLASLSRVPFEQLKLGKSLVRSMEDRQGAQIIAAAFSLAKPFNFLICAKGVKTPFQHRRLAEMGCMLAQGAYYAAPLSGYRLIEWLDRHTHQCQRYTL